VNELLGRSGVLLGFLGAVAGVAVLAVGLARGRPETLRHGRRYAALVLGGALLATGAMEHALITHDFSLAYVAQNNSRQTPLLYTITGMWSALAGSILLWALVLSGYLVAMVLRFRRRADDALVGWATLVVFVVAAFFFGLMVGPANPFQTVAGPVPANGAGPNPLLQDYPLVAFHPPLLYLGFVGFTVPFAFAVGALATGRVHDGLLAETRRFVLVAWGFLGAGIVLGMWWSYQVLGWGGFWAWDPVENAALLPWLCGAAYLHSSIAEEQRGMLRAWNLSLVVAAFALTIFGTFLTRSGVLASVHAFSDSDLGPVLLGFFGAVVACGVGLIGWRGDRLRSAARVRSVVSREAAFVANNLAFSAFALVVLFGTTFPLVAGAFFGQQVTVGPPYYDEMAGPIALALVFLMAVGPLLPYRGASFAAVRSRLAVPAWLGALTLVGAAVAGVRGIVPLLTYGLAAFAAATALVRLAASVRGARRSGRGVLGALVGRTTGGMVVHVGIAVVAVALVTSLSFGHRGQVTLAPGQTARFAGHTITYLGTRTVVRPNRKALEADVLVDGGRTVFHPAVSQFGSDTEEVGTPAVSSTPAADVYLTLVGPPQGRREAAVIGVIVQPLVAWLWIGGGIVAFGVLLSLLPSRRRRERAGPRPPSRPEAAVREVPAVTGAPTA
jgi:cytochrome c-type biogenesis protein CcmF